MSIMRTITTEQINEILKRQHRGGAITRTENFNYQGRDGTLNNNFVFTYTAEEMKEYIMCANDPIYFIENYCTFASQLGITGNVKLYAFQKEWIKKYQENRFLLQSIADQSGYMNITACYYLWYMTFNFNKSILILPSRKGNGMDLLNKISSIYRRLPYFLKRSLNKLTTTDLRFNNNMSIKVRTTNEDSNYDIIHMLEFHSKDYQMFTNVITTQSCLKDSKLIVHSNPKDGGDIFKTLVTNADRKENDPLKNIFDLIKTYWWEVPNRDMAWREERIKEFGQDFFDKRFDNLF